MVNYQTPNESVPNKECKRESAPKWVALIADRAYPMPRSSVTTEVLRAQAGVDSEMQIARDYDTPNDPVLEEGETVDLREGNVFKLVSGCSPQKNPHCDATPKLAFACDDAWEITLMERQTGESLRQLFDLPNDVELLRDFESPNDETIGLDDCLDFRDGPVFRISSREKVEVTIDESPFLICPGKVSVERLKEIGEVDPADELVQLISGQLHPLQDEDSVCINGGEKFIAHPRQGGSS